MSLLTAIQFQTTNIRSALSNWHYQAAPFVERLQGTVTATFTRH